MEDPERMMMGMGGGPYAGGFQHRGPMPEAFGRYPHGGMNQGPRHPLGSNMRERGELAGGDGYHEGQGYHKEGSEGLGHKEGRAYSERHSGGPGGGQDGGENRRGGLHRGALGGGDVHGQGPRGGISGHHGGHRDWGAAASSDEPMDFSKPVFEEEVVSAPSNSSRKQSPAPGQKDETSTEEVKREDVRPEVNTEKSVVEMETVKDEEKKVVVAGKSVAVVGGISDGVAGARTVEVMPTVKNRVEGGDVSEVKEHVERKMQNSVDKEVVAKVVTKDSGGKWERGSRRADIQNREVIGPAAGGAPSANMRSGQQRSGSPGKSSILGNVPRNAAADVAGPQLLQHGSQESPSATSAVPPAVEIDVPKAAEKGRILRRPESPKVEPRSVDSGASDVSSSLTTSSHESSTKEAPKAKGKASSHDGEKEWRPKAPTVEASPRPSTGGTAAQTPKAVATSSSVAAEPTEDKTAESETGPKPGSYDYDAQVLVLIELISYAVLLRKVVLGYSETCWFCVGGTQRIKSSCGVG